MSQPRKAVELPHTNAERNEQALSSRPRRAKEKEGWPVGTRISLDPRIVKSPLCHHHPSQHVDFPASTDDNPVHWKSPRSSFIATQVLVYFLSHIHAILSINLSISLLFHAPLPHPSSCTRVCRVNLFPTRMHPLRAGLCNDSFSAPQPQPVTDSSTASHGLSSLFASHGHETTSSTAQ